MTHLVFVEATPGGWVVRSERIENDLMFLSGAKAEASAKTLAERLSQSGEAAEIRVHLVGGALAGRFVCPPFSADLSLVS